MSQTNTDDPDKLLNDWLGELDNLIGVSHVYIKNINFLARKKLKIVQRDENYMKKAKNSKIFVSSA
jgi:hypothetical protein